VATPVGSIPDAVINGQTGLLVPVDDDEALGQALARLVGDASLRQRLAAGARRLYEEKFTIGVYTRTLESVYRDLV
jgi:glycosyltransferase involved in cell wall biosynthesis